MRRTLPIALVMTALLYSTTAHARWTKCGDTLIPTSVRSLASEEELVHDNGTYTLSSPGGDACLSLKLHTNCDEVQSNWNNQCDHLLEIQCGDITHELLKGVTVSFYHRDSITCVVRTDGNYEKGYLLEFMRNTYNDSDQFRAQPSGCGGCALTPTSPSPTPWMLLGFGLVWLGWSRRRTGR